MMLFNAKGAAVAALLIAGAMPACAQQGTPPPAPAAAQQGRCGGLFCDMYYSAHPPTQPGAPEPAPGQPGSIFLPCHDFVCGMFGGRTPDAPTVAAAEPAPAPSEPAAKPKKKHAGKHAAERTAKNEAKPSKSADPAAQ